MWRDAGRRRSLGYEHSVITTGETIVQKFDSYSFRKDHPEGYDPGLHFAEDGTPSGGRPAETITVPFSNVKTGVFTYDDANGRYLIEEYGAPYVDGNTWNTGGCDQCAHPQDPLLRHRRGQQRPYHRRPHQRRHWLLCLWRQLIEICWSKDGRNSPPPLYCTGWNSHHTGRGSSYVNIVPLDCAVQIQ